MGSLVRSASHSIVTELKKKIPTEKKREFLSVKDPYPDLRENVFSKIIEEMIILRRHLFACQCANAINPPAQFDRSIQHSQMIEMIMHTLQKRLRCVKS